MLVVSARPRSNAPLTSESFAGAERRAVLKLTLSPTGRAQVQMYVLRNTVALVLQPEGKPTTFKPCARVGELRYLSLAEHERLRKIPMLLRQCPYCAEPGRERRRQPTARDPEGEPRVRSHSREGSARMRVIGYTRVSTDEQGRSGLGLAAQRQAIERHCAARDWDVTWMSDEGVSAKSLARPALQEALSVVRRHEAEAVVVAKLDRLSRSVQDFAGLLDSARKQGWAIVAIDLGVDTTTSAGELVANVMAAVAQWERRAIGERTSAALRAAQARGVHVGRPASLDAVVEERLLSLREDGLSLARIAALLNAENVPGAHGGRWHPSTVARVLRRLASRQEV